MSTMRAARWYAAGDVRVEDVPVPTPQPGELLLRVERTGICGSDIEEYREGPVAVARSPITLGHEVLGTVVECRGGDLPIGTLIVPDVVDGCGICWWCLRHEYGLCQNLSVRGQAVDGGLAEYMIARSRTALTVPNDVDLDVAAFAEPTAVAVRAVRKAGNLAGATACVIGAGTIGNLICQVLAGFGVVATVVSEPVEFKRRLALELGATHATDPPDGAAMIESVTSGRGADIVFECTGIPSCVRSALEFSRRGGTIVLVGFQPIDVSLPLMDIVVNEQRIIGTAAHVWDQDVAAAVALLANGRVNPLPLLSAVVPLESVAKSGFEYLVNNRDSMKVLVAPRPIDNTSGSK